VSFGARTFAGGTTGALPDISTRVDTVSGQDIQVAKLADATEGSNTPVGTDANPLKTKPRRWGTQDFNTGLVAVTNGAPTSITAATVYPERAFATNKSTTTSQKLTLTNTADVVQQVHLIPPNTTIPLPCAGSWVGIKAGADGADVVLKIDGEQA
jgi:hypothetical protein